MAVEVLAGSVAPPGMLRPLVHPIVISAAEGTPRNGSPLPLFEAIIAALPVLSPAAP